MKSRNWKSVLAFWLSLCLALALAAPAYGAESATASEPLGEPAFLALVATAFPGFAAEPSSDQPIPFARALAVLCEALGLGGQTDAQNLRFALENNLIPGITLAGDDPVPADAAQRMIDAFAAWRDAQAEQALADRILTVFSGTVAAQPSGAVATESFGIPFPSVDYNGMNDESYGNTGENRFLNPVDSPFSTFALDVDTASYANVRRCLLGGAFPDRGAIRLEEMLNYFAYDLPTPSRDQPIAITTELNRCPWNPAHQLALVALSSYAPAKADLPGSNLVFLADVSGSMEAYNRLPLACQALKLLLTTLAAKDRVSIVTYASNAGVLLDATPADRKDVILAAIDGLRAGGSTNGEGGIQAAYDQARKAFIDGGNNRVILLTDGDFNVGVQSAAELEALITRERESGVYLSVLGFGMGNLKDYEMETLADCGNGNYAYIDTLKEAQKVLVEDMTGTLFTVARDVKLQVEFNPAQVSAYRLLGYENRLLNTEDFTDDRVDAGEMGAGRRMVALYEIVPAAQAEPTLPTADSRYQAKTLVSSGETLCVSVRYQLPDTGETRQTGSALSAPEPLGAMSETLAFAAAVAEFGLVLSDSAYRADASLADAAALALANRGTDEYGYRAEFVQLIRLAQLLDTP